MDQKKIGKYISDKRKLTGFTQEELGEKLGVSGKAVSKWECGKSMPDLSLFRELCELLGISINELFSGEDIPEDEIVACSEKSIITVFAEGLRKNKKLKIVIAILAAVIVCYCGALLIKAYKNGDFLRNYVEGFEDCLDEMDMAGLIGVNYVCGSFSIQDSCQSLVLTEHIYKNGELYEEDEPGSSVSTESGSKQKGKFALVWDDAHDEIAVSLSADGSTTLMRRNIADYVGEDMDENGFGVVGPEAINQKTEIRKGEAVTVLAISFNTYGTCSGGTIDAHISPDNEWTFIYTLEYK